MRLNQFAEGSTTVLPMTAVAADAEFAAEVQGQLHVAGLLDWPPDSRFGPVSEWALQAFCKRTGLSLDSGFTREIARRLAGVSPAKPLYAIDFSAADFAARIVMTMQRQTYWIAMHPECANIVYIEGCDPNGDPNGNVPNQFNDLRLIISISADGKPKIDGAWEATTEPGRYWTQHPMNPNGAARVAFGQFKAWSVGTHNAGKASAHEALVQVRSLNVFRDFNRDYQRAGDHTDSGIFGINQHWGYDRPKDDLSTSSAGCLVGRSRAGHRQFMTRVKEDPRYAANHSYRFITTIMPVAALSE